MIKKAAHMILVMLVVISTGGVTIFRHYCGGIVTNTSIGHATPCCAMPCKHCQDKAVTYKIHDEFATSSREVIPTHGTPLPISFSVAQAKFHDLEPGLHPNRTFPHSPPLLSGTSLKKAALIQVFLI